MNKEEGFKISLLFFDISIKFKKWDFESHLRIWKDGIKNFIGKIACFWGNIILFFIVVLIVGQFGSLYVIFSDIFLKGRESVDVLKDAYKNAGMLNGAIAILSSSVMYVAKEYMNKTGEIDGRLYKSIFAMISIFVILISIIVSINIMNGTLLSENVYNYHWIFYSLMIAFSFIWFSFEYFSDDMASFANEMERGRNYLLQDLDKKNSNNSGAKL